MEQNEHWATAFDIWYRKFRTEQKHAPEGMDVIAWIVQNTAAIAGPVMKQKDTLLEEQQAEIDALFTENKRLRSRETALQRLELKIRSWFKKVA